MKYLFFFLALCLSTQQVSADAYSRAKENSWANRLNTAKVKALKGFRRHLSKQLGGKVKVSFLGRTDNGERTARLIVDSYSFTARSKKGYQCRGNFQLRFGGFDQFVGFSDAPYSVECAAPDESDYSSFESTYYP